MTKPSKKTRRQLLDKLGIEKTTTEVTGTDVYKSLIRLDRLVIAKYFDAPIERLMEEHEMDGTTALIFVHMRREGMKDREAYNAAANLTNEQIWAYFAPDDDDDQAETPAGKGGSSETSSSMTSPTTEPVSA